MNFASDNTSGIAPEILEAIARANAGAAASYGEDDISRNLARHFAEIFETDVTVFPVATGTAANALALATLSPSWGAILCHQESHIFTNEANAPEFFTGGAKLVPLPGENGKLDAATVAAQLPGGLGSVHYPQPSLISLTQSTEAGTVYQPGEIAAIADVARRHHLALHMDGARFANAVAHLAGATPADITWRAGVDVLTFGATKNGAMAAEAVVFFGARAQAAALAFGERIARQPPLLDRQPDRAAQQADADNRYLLEKHPQVSGFSDSLSRPMFGRGNAVRAVPAVERAERRKDATRCEVSSGGTGRGFPMGVR